VPDLEQPLFIDLIRGVESILYQNKYCMSVFNAEQSLKKELEIAKIIDNRFIDGVIFSGVYGNEREEAFIIEMQKRKIPCVMVDRIIPNVNTPYVSNNDYLGGKIAAKFLLKNNHKRIGIISYDTKTYIFDQRVKGFTDVLNLNGIGEEFVLDVPLEYRKIEKSIHNNGNKILGKNPSAIFTTSDSIAILLMSFLSEKGIKIPDEVSVMGYDNMIFSRFSFPKLTTVNHDMFELGKVVGKNLINKLENGKYSKRVQVLNPNLVIRDSVRKI
jgi:DNA-binding LacI/PurR family transcriptional regulator